MLTDMNSSSIDSKNTPQMAKSSSSNHDKSLLASGLSLSFFTLLSRILGLLREMTKAAFLGTTGYADAFGIAFMIPNLFRRLFAENSISVAFIPTFRGYLEDCNTPEGKQRAKEFVSATLTLITFLTATVVLIGIIITPLIIPFFYSGSGDTPLGDTTMLVETTLLTRIMFPYLFVISIAAFFQGVLNGVKIFSPSGFTPVLFNSIVIAATYILAPHTANPARAMAIGVIGGGCVQALFQLPFVIHSGWGCGFTSIKKAFKNPGTRRVIALIGPTIIGMAAYQLNDVVSTALAGRAGEGVVSSLQYSLRLQELILGIFAVSIGTVILPDLSGLAKEEKWESFNKMLTKAVMIIALIAIPITFYSLITGKEIIQLVYKSRRFTDDSVRLTLTAFRWHIAGLYFIAMNRVVSPAFYAQGNTKSPTIAGIFGFIVNIILALTLVHPMAGGGIALALSLASLANTVFLFIFLKNTHVVNINHTIVSIIVYSLKMTVYSLIASVPAWFVNRAAVAAFGSHGRLLGNFIPLTLTLIIFASIGIALLIITKDPMITALKSKVTRKFSKRK
jgi:putative peptidoglycan lipid II flippase